MLVTTLAPAAPMRVPAAPSRDPITAAVTAASAAAAMWMGLRSILCLVLSERVGECGAVMVSDLSVAISLPAEGGDVGLGAGYANHCFRPSPAGVAVDNDRQDSAGAPAGLASVYRVGTRLAASIATPGGSGRDFWAAGSAA